LPIFRVKESCIGVCLIFSSFGTTISILILFIFFILLLSSLHKNLMTFFYYEILTFFFLYYDYFFTVPFVSFENVLRELWKFSFERFRPLSS
jgi:hypothetical protein